MVWRERRTGAGPALGRRTLAVGIAEDQAPEPARSMRFLRLARSGGTGA